MSNTKKVILTVDLVSAWEEWIIEVPADADADWIENNPDQWEFLGLNDAGNSGMKFVSVEMEEA